jgi:hypothetical protein
VEFQLCFPRGSVCCGSRISEYAFNVPPKEGLLRRVWSSKSCLYSFKCTMTPSMMPTTPASILRGSERPNFARSHAAQRGLQRVIRGCGVGGKDDQLFLELTHFAEVQVFLPRYPQYRVDVYEAILNNVISELQVQIWR